MKYRVIVKRLVPEIVSMLIEADSEEESLCIGKAAAQDVNPCRVRVKEFQSETDVPNRAIVVRGIKSKPEPQP